METKLFVGNLSYDTSEDDLRSLFSKAGSVASVTLIKDRDSGRSKGFAFVEMASQTEAEQAIKMFNGFSMDNRDLKVDKARPREERPYSGYDNSRYGQNKYGDRNRRSGGGGKSSRRY
ncbi:MAG TPA: RNA-binding protein [Anaerolineales bacterium]|nr:RNA-binding protein [Anaerolineales bacterium]